MLEVKNLSVKYGQMTVVEDVSFSVDESEAISLLGSNGAGKSSTIRAISGLIRPSAGKVEFNGVDITGMEAYKIMNLGLVQIPEGRKLFGNMTVRENLEMGSYSKAARSKRRENLEYVYEMLPDLKMKENDLAGSLSGGQQQMLAIGRGMMACPKMIIFDEPSIGLSPLLTSTMFTIIKKIHDSGVAVILVEQNVRQALRITDYAYVLEQGKMTLSGSAKEIVQNEYLKKAYLGM